MARTTLIDDSRVNLVHCISRCVRRAWLCGVDPYDHRDYEHRKEWFRERLEFLTTVFGFEVFSYAVLSNHGHIVGRTRPDLVAEWSAEEVARRWGRLYPERDVYGRALPVDDDWIRGFVRDEGRVELMRERLRSVSWFMRCLNENIARRANREDGCSGRFWQGRFKCQLLADEGAVLACMAYVDLNPVRAGIADTPEESEFTSIYERILAARRIEEPTEPVTTSTEAVNASPAVATGGCADELVDAVSKKRPEEPDSATAPAGTGCPGKTTGASWLVPIEEIFSVGCSPVPPLRFETYLELVDTTGRMIREDKTGAIDPSLAPILQRIGLNSGHWVTTVRRYGGLFRRMAGQAQHLRALARKSGQKWVFGIRASAASYQRNPGVAAA